MMVSLHSAKALGKFEQIRPPMALAFESNESHCDSARSIVPGSKQPAAKQAFKCASKHTTGWKLMSAVGNMLHGKLDELNDLSLDDILPSDLENRDAVVADRLKMQLDVLSGDPETTVS